MNLALLAEAHADTRRMYADYLRRLSYDIEEAEDGREALAKTLSHRPAVLVTATVLPGISGWELCRLLRSEESTKLMPIVVVANGALEDVRVAETAGADAVVVKPCLPERLAGEIQRVLSRSYELRARGRAAQERIFTQVSRSKDLMARSATARRGLLIQGHKRHDTTCPPDPPPALICPECDQPLRYERSHIGGVSARNPEQWDYFVCPRGCGRFQYRPRTRKTRRIA